jgi:hypothetical protein
MASSEEILATLREQRVILSRRYPIQSRPVLGPEHERVPAQVLEVRGGAPSAVCGAATGAG